MKDNYLSTKESLMTVELPKQTSTYKPVSHLQLMDLTMQGIENSGFQIEREIYESRKNGLVASGKYLLKGIGDNEMQLQAVWQNSYDKSVPLKFVIGAMVLVCENGMISMRSMGEYKHKHISDVQEISPLIIPERIKTAGEIFVGLQGERDQMKAIEVNSKMRSELIGRMFLENEIITGTHLNVIKKQIKNPTHQYNAPNTLWELYQFVTFAIGGFNPNWVQDHVNAHQFFMDVVAEEVA